MTTTIKMKAAFYGILGVILLAFAIPVQAQVDYSDFLSSGELSSYRRIAVVQRKMVPVPLVQEVDAKYSKRIIRCIDARQKMNKQLEWPRSALNQILGAGLSEGSIIAYKSDSLASSYTSTQIVRRMGHEIVTSIAPDSTDPTYIIDTVIWADGDYTKIRKFWVMEDWVFDSKYSVFKPRIIAIAPIFAPELQTVTAPEQPLCWIKMDEIRQLLANKDMFNRYNESARLSYDDFFQMRIFDSYIVYESNVFDNYVNQFQEYENDQVGALLKSDEIKNDLFIFEHDLWQF